MAQNWVKRAMAQASAMRLPLLVALLLTAMSTAAGAQTPAPARPAAPAHAASGISPADAQTALSVLRDDKRRADLITTLEVIAKTAPPASGAAKPAGTDASPAPASPQAPAKPAAATIAPDSVGAQLASRFSLLLSAYAEQLANSFRALNDLPALFDWVRTQATDPVARTETIDAAVKLLVVFALALAAEWLTGRVLRRLRALLIAVAPRRAEHETDAGGARAADAPTGRFDRALAALRQLPALIGRLLLDLLPVGAFAVVAFLLLGTALGRPTLTRLVLLDALEAYGLARIILAVAAFLYSPATPRLRLLGVADGAARFLTRWTRRLVIVGVTGWAVTAIAGTLGMPGYAQLSLTKLVALVIHACLVVAVLQVRAPVAKRLRPRRTATGMAARIQEQIAETWHWVAIFFIVALWLVWAIEVRNGYERLLTFCVETALIALAGRQLGILVLGGLDRLRGRLAPAGAEDGGRASLYFPALRAMLWVVIFFGTGVALFEAWGFPLLFWLTSGGLGGQVWVALRTIVVAIMLAIGAWELINGMLLAHLSTLSGSAQFARAGRLRTLLPLLRTALLVTILLVVGMTVLSAIGVNIAPLLAGAGVIGIAVGFGSQKLVQDLITGLFLLLENAMQVGDVVTAGGLTGSVEALTIRTIRLRALDGAVHLIPFSSVTTVTNMTRDFSYAVVDVSVGLNEEPEPIERVLRAVGEELRQDPQYQSLVLDSLDIMGVEKLTDAAWIMRVRLKTQPSSRWAVGREFNRRIKVRFDELAIESPFTSHKILSREAPPPASLATKEQEPAT